MVVGQVTERFDVDPAKYLAVVEAVGQLSKKAEQRGLGEITLDRVKSSDHAITIQIASPTPAIGDYELVAKISHMKGGRISIQPLSRGRLDFAAIRSDHSIPVCEHCRVNRPRKVTFLLNGRSGGDVQVGSSCLKDYVGESDPRKALVQADLFAQARELVIAAAPPPAEHEPKRGWPSVAEYLAHVAAVIRHEGEFVRKADVDADHSATADLALRNFRQTQDGGEAIELTTADRDLAERASREFRDRAGREKKLSGYDQRLVNVLDKDVAWPENQGILATVFERATALRRHQEPAATRRRASNWLGEVGDTVTAVVSLRKVGSPTDSRFGKQRPHFFLTEDGDWVTWWATNIQLEPERRYELTGKVKRHDERKGHRVTVLTRCQARELETA